MGDDLFFTLERLLSSDPPKELYCPPGGTPCAVYRGAQRLSYFMVDWGIVAALSIRGYLYQVGDTVYRITPSGRAAYQRDRDARIAHHALTGE